MCKDVSAGIGPRYSHRNNNAVDEIKDPLLTIFSEKKIDRICISHRTVYYVPTHKKRFPYKSSSASIQSDQEKCE